MSLVDEIKAELELFKPVLKEEFQVETIGIFGSHSRGEQKTKSDFRYSCQICPTKQQTKTNPKTKHTKTYKTKRSGTQNTQPQKTKQMNFIS
jgi:hypothetical protein